MNYMKLMYLNSVLVVPSEAGQKKIEKALKKNKLESKKDQYGRTKENYEDLGMEIPKELLENDEIFNGISEDGTILLKDEEMEYEFMDCIINLKDFSTAIDNQQIGCVIYTQQGDEIHVVEEVEDVFSYITYLTRPWYIVLIDSIKNRWWRIKYSFNKKINYAEMAEKELNKPIE